MTWSPNSSHETYCSKKANPLVDFLTVKMRHKKSFFGVIFTEFTSKSLFLGSNWAIIQFTLFFAQTCLMTEKENSKKLGTLPLAVLKISQKKTQNKLD